MTTTTVLAGFLAFSTSVFALPISFNLHKRGGEDPFGHSYSVAIDDDEWEFEMGGDFNSRLPATDFHIVFSQRVDEYEAEFETDDGDWRSKLSKDRKELWFVAPKKKGAPLVYGEEFEIEVDVEFLRDVGPNFRAVASWTDDRKPRKPVPSGGSTLAFLLLGSAGLAGVSRLLLS